MSSFSRRVLVATGIVLSLLVLLYFVQHVANALLLVFAGVLLAVFLSGVAQLLRHYARLPRGVALAAGIFLVLAFLGGAGWLIGPRVSEQFGDLTQRLPASIEELRTMASRYPLGEFVFSHLPGQSQDTSTSLSELAPSNLLGRITGVFSKALSAIANVLVVVVVGLFMAINPSTYVNGVAHLFPKSRRSRVREVFAATGHGLRWWLVGRLSSMLVVGMLTGLGLWIVGMPLVFALGFIAGLFSFVPYVGPIVSALPGLLIALTTPSVALWVVIVVYLSVQLLESNAITPLIQQRTVSLPPALLVIVQLLGGILAGLLGVLVATPLSVALIVITQMVYIEDVLGDRVETMGE